MQDDYYKTIKTFTETEFKEKGSRFINKAFPVKDRVAAEEIIAEISKKFYDATHNCFAYSIGNGPQCVTRFNDDGEPSGTAGKPILQAIEGRELTDVLVIVTRYFGGTKLGTGGLIRAYGGGAAQVLDEAKTVICYIKESITFEYDYALSNLVNTCIQKYKADVINTDFSDTVLQTIQIRSSLLKAFADQIVDQSAGKIKIIED